MTHAEIKAAVEAMLDRIDAYHTASDDEETADHWTGDIHLTFKTVEEQLRTLVAAIDL